VIAGAYDAVLGRQGFAHARPAFEAMVRRYGITFGSAADLGCGTGLFARHLAASRGIPVFAVDRAPAMLGIAARRCQGVPVQLLVQDIRGLRLPRPVDLVTANADVVNHLTRRADLRRAFRSIRASLSRGGHFVFDFITDCRPLGGRRLFRRRSRVGPEEVWQTIRWDPGRRLLVGLIVRGRRAGGGPWVAERHLERGYAPAEIGQALADTAFVVRGVHDALTLAPARTCPARAIVVARAS
jgi:SAM-dependent methyltransferase